VLPKNKIEATEFFIRFFNKLTLLIKLREIESTKKNRATTCEVLHENWVYLNRKKQGGGEKQIRKDLKEMTGDCKSKQRAVSRFIFMFEQCCMNN